MSDPTLIADLVRAGVEPELVGRVSNALVNVRDNVRDNAVQEYERTRKRNWRKTTVPQSNSTPAKANDVAGSGAENVPANVPDNSANPPTFLSSQSLNLEGSIEQGSKKKKKEGTEIARARGTRMQAGAQLNERFRQAAIELGAAPEVVADMWAEHVDYWVGVPGERGVKTEPNGWLATWRNDVRRKIKMGTYNGNGKTRQGGGVSGGSGFSALAFRRARAAGEHH